MSTAPNGYQTPKTNWASADVPTPSDFNRIEANIQAVELGNRTIDPAQAPSGNTGTLRQLLDWFANRIRAILDTTDWYGTPPTTLSAAKAHIDALAPHAGHETPAGAQQKVDAAMSSHLNDGDPHPQYASDAELAAKVSKSGDTMTGPLKLADGTAAAPGLAFGSDSDTGLYRAGTDILAFAAGGAERFRIDTAGPKVGTNKVWHAGNDGAGSGLDADLLQGKRWVTVASGSVTIASNTAVNVNLRSGGAHRHYIASVYSDQRVVQHELNVSGFMSWHVEQNVAGNYDWLALENRTSTSRTMYYSVLAWE